MSEPEPFSGDYAADFSGTGNRYFSGTGNRNRQQSVEYSTNRCARCVNEVQLSPITRVVAPLAYAGCAAVLVQQQKDRRGAVAARVLAELLGDAVLASYQPLAAEHTPSLLLPVPLHWRREWQRGHNQSALLATHLSRRLQLPIAQNIVRRTRATRSQQQLNVEARRANMQNAFAMDSTQPQLRNARIAIIDDVLTTGATARALASVLCQAGVAEVHLWSPTRAILSENRAANTTPPSWSTANNRPSI